MFWRKKHEFINTVTAGEQERDTPEDISHLPEHIRRIRSKNQSTLTQKELIALAEYFRQTKDWAGIAFMKQLLPADVYARHAVYAKLDTNTNRDPQTVNEAITMMAAARELRKKRERRFPFVR